MSCGAVCQVLAMLVGGVGTTRYTSIGVSPDVPNQRHAGVAQNEAQQGETSTSLAAILSRSTRL